MKHIQLPLSALGVRLSESDYQFNKPAMIGSQEIPATGLFSPAHLTMSLSGRFHFLWRPFLIMVLIVSFAAILDIPVLVANVKAKRHPVGYGECIGMVDAPGKNVVNPAGLGLLPTQLKRDYHLSVWADYFRNAPKQILLLFGGHFKAFHKLILKLGHLIADVPLSEAGYHRILQGSNSHIESLAVDILGAFVSAFTVQNGSGFASGGILTTWICRQPIRRPYWRGLWKHLHRASER